MTLRQYVTFKIDENLVGIDILNVREINRLLDITPVQHAPDYVRGLINLRGNTITIFDLGIRLGFGRRTICEESYNVVLKKEPIGLLVDRIGDVVEVLDDDIEMFPANMGTVERQYVEGITELKNDLLLILSPESILEYNSIA